MYYLIAVALLVYSINFLLAPFPHWPTFFQLWSAVLSNRSQLPLNAKIKQALLLMRYLLTSPLFTFLWYLDKAFYPSYRDIIIKPIFIIGEPRNGTTLLHRTLASDEETFFSIRHYEWRYPFIALLKLIKWSGFDHKIKSLNYWPATPAGDQAAKMHPNTLYDYEEDGTFFEENFLHHLLVINKFPYTHLIQLLDSFPELPAKQQLALMTIHREVLQKIAYLKGQNHFYLSKEVLGHNKLTYLMKMYPDAKFIVNLRNSTYFLSSWLELTKITIASNTGIDTVAIPNFNITLVNRMQQDCSTLLNFLQQQHGFKIVTVPFNQLSENLAHTIIKIYRQLQLVLPSSFRQYLSTIQNQQKNRQRGYDYTVEQRKGFENFDDYVLRAQNNSLITPSESCEHTSSTRSESSIDNYTTPICKLNI